jgi:hypothetical protein
MLEVVNGLAEGVISGCLATVRKECERRYIYTGFPSVVKNENPD